MKRLVLVAGLTTAVLVPLAAPASAATVSYANCTSLQKSYPHGIGKKGAHDKVSGTSKPVTTFRQDTAGYTKAVKANSRLDGDKDGIACEKK